MEEERSGSYRRGPGRLIFRVDQAGGIMRRSRRWSVLLVATLMLVGCAAASPPSRLSRYVAAAATSEEGVPRLPASRPVPTALVILNDRSDPESVPGFPEDAQTRVVDMLAAELNRAYPIVIERVVTVGDVSEAWTAPDWREVARQQGVNHLLVAVLSSIEQEYPVSLFLGWTTHRQPGLRRDNWSLAEAALIDGRTGRRLLQAEGRAMATLDRPAAPGISQWYPVIYLRPQEPERRIWPPTYEGAPLTLRVVAMEHAVTRLAGNLQRAWIEQLAREALHEGVASR